MGSFGKKGILNVTPKERREIGRKILDSLAERVPEMPTWLVEGVFSIAERAVRSLRRALEDPSVPVTWNHPVIQLAYPAELVQDEDGHLSLVDGIFTEEELFAPYLKGGPDDPRWKEIEKRLGARSKDDFKTFAERLARAHTRERDLAVLKALDRDVVVSVASGTYSLLSAPDHLVQEWEALPEEERGAAALEPFVLFGGGKLDQPRRGQKSLETIQLALVADDPKRPFEALLRLAFFPLHVNEDEGKTYFPVVVGWEIKNGDPSTRTEEELESLWKKTLGFIEDLKRETIELSGYTEERREWLAKKAQEEMELIGEALDKKAQEEPEKISNRARQAYSKYLRDLQKQPLPTKTPPEAELVRSVMSPVPVPRRAVKNVGSLAFTRGLGAMFSNYSKVPDLDLKSEIATEDAEKIFWVHLEEYFNQAVQDGKVTSWERKNAGDHIVLLLRGVQVDQAKKLWEALQKTLNKGSEPKNEGPGIEVVPPGFVRANRLEDNVVFVETRLELWPAEDLKDRDGYPVPPVRFRTQGSPGYLALIDRHGPRPFMADGWLWVPRGNEREGFRIGELPTLLFPEGRAALERMKKKDLAGYEERLQKTFIQPDLYKDYEAKVKRDLETAVRRTKNWLKDLSVYNVGHDLILCIFEAFHRQKDDWIAERLRLTTGQTVETKPWRIIRLDPRDLRFRLDPGETWGQNWRGRMFRRLEALTTFERQTRTRTGRRVDVGDRLLQRVIDGRQGVGEGTVPEADSGLGLTRILKRAGAFPTNSFFVEVSLDFMARLVTWAADDKGKVRWGIDAARAAERKALLVDPKDQKGATQVKYEKRQDARSKPYYDHSPRLMSLANLEAWPESRKQLAYALLQEVTPNFEHYTDKQGTKRKRKKKNPRGGKHALVTLDGQDYVSCNGSKGRGYRVKVWIRNVGYQTRTGPGGGVKAFRSFVEDLKELARPETLDLHLEVKQGKQSSLWNEVSLRLLENYQKDPTQAYDLKLRCYLPEEMEDRLKDRLAEAGIDAVDEDEIPAILTPSRPGGLTPADIRMARREAGWKQDELAGKLGVSKMAVSHWETGKKPIPKDREAALREVLKDHLRVNPQLTKRPLR